MGCNCCDNDKPKGISKVSQIGDNELVCYCEDVSKKAIINAILSGAKNVKEVSGITGACKTAAKCEELNPQKRCCAIDIMELIKITGEKR